VVLNGVGLIITVKSKEKSTGVFKKYHSGTFFVLTSLTLIFSAAKYGHKKMACALCSVSIYDNALIIG